MKSPTRRKKQKYRHVKTSPPTQQTRSRHRFSPITVPGTPEHPMVTSIFQPSADNPKMRPHLSTRNLNKAKVKIPTMSSKISTCITKLSIVTNLNRKSPMQNLLPGTKL
jgi:hypothetical protein